MSKGARLAELATSVSLAHADDMRTWALHTLQQQCTLLLFRIVALFRRSQVQLGMQACALHPACRVKGPL
jgi:hypothetical protein